MEKWILIGITIMLLGICTITDVKSKQINLWTIIAGAVATAACLPWMNHLTPGSIIMGVLLGLLLVCISFFTKEQIGMGDSLLFCILGLGHGFSMSAAVLGTSLFLCAVAVMVLLCMGALGKKERIAFTPFILAGYCVVMLV